MQKYVATNSQFTEKRISRLVGRYIHGESWKKVAQIKSKPTNKQDSDKFALSKFVELF